MMHDSFIQSPVFDGEEVAHGFSTRKGGASRGPYAYNNMYAGRGDLPDVVSRNQRAFLDALGLDGLATLHQVHGSEVVVVDSPGELQQDGDALVTTVPGLGIGVYTADCTPILLHAPGIVGAVHSGWRGTAVAVVKHAVEKMVEMGARQEEIRAAIGPAIGPCCYEVGEEVVRVFEELGFSGYVIPRSPRPHLDVPGIVRAQLLKAGLKEENVWNSGLCTHCREDLFYSYRRTGWPTGQMLAVIGLRG